MKLNRLAPLLLSLLASPAFAHSYHDDDAPQPPPKYEVRKDGQAVETKASPTEKKPDSGRRPHDDAQAPPAAPAAAAPATPKKP